MSDYRYTSMSLEGYFDYAGNWVTANLYWLENGRDIEGNAAARYGFEDWDGSIWIRTDTDTETDMD